MKLRLAARFNSTYAVHEFHIHLIVGPGAGHKTGYTAYIAVNCQGRYPNRFVNQDRKLLRIGCTRNSNLVPYARFDKYVELGPVPHGNTGRNVMGGIAHKGD